MTPRCPQPRRYSHQVLDIAANPGRRGKGKGMLGQTVDCLIELVRNRVFYAARRYAELAETPTATRWMCSHGKRLLPVARSYVAYRGQGRFYASSLRSKPIRQTPCRFRCQAKGWDVDARYECFLQGVRFPFPKERREIPIENAIERGRLRSQSCS